MSRKNSPSLTGKIEKKSCFLSEKKKMSFFGVQKSFQKKIKRRRRRRRKAHKNLRGRKKMINFEQFVNRDGVR
jgi:hypothetical protein